jgi:hypothetical protein
MAEKIADGDLSRRFPGRPVRQKADAGSLRRGTVLFMGLFTLTNSIVLPGFPGDRIGLDRTYLLFCMVGIGLIPLASILNCTVRENGSDC